MRPIELKVGKTYSNGKRHETLRKITEIIYAEYMPYLVKFEVLKGKYKGVPGLNILAYSFAKWADYEIKEAHREQ